MKKNLLLIMMCAPVLLAAQNGVTVSNLIVNAGTVTFNVSWRTPMPVAVWSDSVWVFVDYNNAGKMERLPVTNATVSAGTVTEIPGNDKGVWVIGNARTTGHFSATVQLYTATVDIAGACAYASNYPPVGEYISDTKISFTGTPMYEIVLKNGSSATSTWYSTGQFTVPPGYTVQSFSDKTGAPGIMNCTPLGATVNFTAFKPCNIATTGDYWYLTDTRESNNVQTYKVKLMADGHIWMVQDLKFGDKCNKTTFAGSNGKDQAGNLTTLTDKTYYGDCSNSINSSTPANRGYFYSWAAAINKPDAYYGSSANVGCSGIGSSANACQGICPVGWHVPTGGTDGDYATLLAAYPECARTNDECWKAGSMWDGVYGGLLTPTGLALSAERGEYLSSTADSRLWYFEFNSTSSHVRYDTDKDDGMLLRCVMNY
jgi:uncharacterized protein (TIGR02145 family)